MRKEWESLQAQREFMDKLSVKLGISKISDWTKISRKTIVSHGGKSIFKESKSLQEALKLLYPEAKSAFEELKFISKKQNGSWKPISNQRLFMDAFASKYGIRTKEDWIAASKRKILNGHGLGGVLVQYKTKFDLFNTIYPEYGWDPLDFPRVERGHWKSEKNLRHYFDKLKEKFNIQTAEDWKKIPLARLAKARSVSSSKLAPKDLYPELNWKSVRSKHHADYWRNQENQKRFLDEFAKEYGIKDPVDWKNVRRKDIESKWGGLAITQMHSSIRSALKMNYPEENWDFLKESASVKAQQTVFTYILEIFAFQKQKGLF